jgi:hypothetical protein
MNRENWKGVRKHLTRIMSLGLLVGAASCDTDVVNPGPIESEFLNDPASQAAITNGAGRALSDAINWIAYTSAAIAREVHPSGSTGSFGITPEQQRGELNDDEVGTQWENAHRARFLAEDGIERIEALDGADRDQENLAQLYLWAGYTSRVLGESMCSSVYDGGPAGDSNLHLADAITYFSQAATLGAGSEIEVAAVAGRAGANLMAGNLTAASDDATAALGLAADFSYEMPYFDIGDDAQSNRIYVAGKAAPYKAHSQIFTWITEYNPQDTTVIDGVADADPRVAWKVSGENGDAASSCCGVIQWFPQQKYLGDDAGIELSSDEEMQLILAEVALRNNDATGAMTIVNALRTAAGQGTETAANIDEAWTFFMREHAIESWLEGRRLPAMRRWLAVFGEEATLEARLQPLERIGDGDTNTGAHLQTRDYCFPVSEAEKQTNENIDIAFPG